MAKLTPTPTAPQQQDTPPPPARLTPATASVIRTQLQQVEQEISKQAGNRADMLRQIDNLHREVEGTETVMSELDGTANRYRQRLAEAGLPVHETGVWPVPGDRSMQQVWPVGDPAHTTTGAPTDNPPIGYCNHCGKPVWRNSKNELTHAIGSICYPDDPNSPVATIGEETGERAS